MRVLTTTLIVLFVLGVMIFTNPSMEDYRMFWTQEMQRDAKKPGRDEGEATLVALFGGLATSFLAGQTVRNDYLLFSTFETSVGKERMRAIGWLRHFYVTETPKRGGA